MNELMNNLNEHYRQEHVSQIECLTRQYTQSHRYYHTLEHITYMFEIARQYEIALSRAQIHAIWWHDAVYDPTSKTNEEDSWRMAQLYHNHLQDVDWLSIVGMIMDTKTHSPRTEESKIVCDLDMFILADVDEYDKYRRLVRQEYSMYSDEEYRQGRIRFLEGLLSKQIFHSDIFKTYHESVAKVNIKDEIRDLQ